MTGQGSIEVAITTVTLKGHAEGFLLYSLVYKQYN